MWYSEKTRQETLVVRKEYPHTMCVHHIYTIYIDIFPFNSNELQRICRELQVLLGDVFEAIQEGISGYLMDHVVYPGTEHYYDPQQELLPKE